MFENYVGPWACGATCLMVLFLIMLHDKAKSLKIATEFRKTFVKQDFVDAHLTALALVFQIASVKQVNLQQNQVEEADTDREVARAKKAFWDAYGLAWKLNYEVKPSYKDYVRSKYQQ